MITMEPRTLRVKAKRPELLPKQAHDGEWYDLCADKEIRLKEGDWGTINLGVCIEVPVGYEAHLQPRSSTFKKYGIMQTNGVGVIDNSYKGDNDWWLMPIYATRDAVIPEGARIAQFKVVPQQERFNIVAVTEMGNDDRGGLGSTGV